MSKIQRRLRRRPSTAPSVYVVGAGISGLTSALRLAQRGYNVTVFEEKAEIGGNLAGLESNGSYYDVYPHMYGEWYHNFWSLVEGDLHLKRGNGGAFEPRYTFKVLDRGSFPEYLDLLTVASSNPALKNLLSGVASPAEMFLWAYSFIDGLTYSAVDDGVLDGISVQGFLRTRPYATQMLSTLHDIILMTIWSVHSDATSAAAYRRFVAPNAPPPYPLFWLLTGDLATTLMRPLKDKIVQAGGTFRVNTRVTEVVVGERSSPAGAAEVTALKIKECAYNRKQDKYREVGSEQTVTVDAARGDMVILAVPPKALGYLVSAGREGHRIVDKVPTLSEVRRLAGEPIPVLTLYFKKKLPNIPNENVLLGRSNDYLTFLDLEQLWHDNPGMVYDGSRRTVLCVAASDYYALTSPNADEQRWQIVEQLHEYLGVFKKGNYWGDPSSDIDWGQTVFETNRDRMLFVNTVGGKQWQPRTHYPDSLANLFFGSDCTVNPIRMATVEAAVVSGLQAASGVWRARPLGEPIEIKTNDLLPTALFAAVKACMAPWAFAAKCWSDAAEVLPALALGDDDAVRQAVTTAALDLYATPYLMAADVWQSLIRAAAESAPARPLTPDAAPGRGRR